MFGEGAAECKQYGNRKRSTCASEILYETTAVSLPLRYATLCHIECFLF